MNMIWRDPKQFTAEKVRAALADKRNKTLVLRTEPAVIQQTLKVSAPASETMAKQPHTEEEISEGIYFKGDNKDEKFDSGTLQAIFTPEEQFPNDKD